MFENDLTPAASPFFPASFNSPDQYEKSGKEAKRPTHSNDQFFSPCLENLSIKDRQIVVMRTLGVLWGLPLSPINCQSAMVGDAFEQTSETMMEFSEPRVDHFLLHFIREN